MKFLSGFALMSILLFSVNSSFAQEGKNIFKCIVGECVVFLLSDGQSTGKVNILTGATSSMLETSVPNGAFPMACNAFLVKIEGKNILVDTGTGAKLFENLASINVNPLQIDIILLTHMHGDHIGGLLENGEVMFPNAEIYLAQEEYDYWTSDEAASKVPENRRGGFDQARTIIEVYKNQLKLFKTEPFDGEVKEIMSFVVAISAHGHTPGHTMYMISSDSRQLLFWGDLTHAMAIQMPYPEVAVTYDVDPEQAIESRKITLDYVSKQHIPVAGMHIPFPSIGNIKPADTGYIFEKIN